MKPWNAQNEMIAYAYSWLCLARLLDENLKLFPNIEERHDLKEPS